jgi:hypothetical protein
MPREQEQETSKETLMHQISKAMLAIHRARDEKSLSTNFVLIQKVDIIYLR